MENSIEVTSSVMVDCTIFLLGEYGVFEISDPRLTIQLVAPDEEIEETIPIPCGRRN